MDWISVILVIATIMPESNALPAVVPNNNSLALPTTEDTSCIADPPCSTLDDDHFQEDCRKEFEPTILEFMRTICENYGTDIASIIQLFSSIEDICQTKGFTISLNLPNCEATETVVPTSAIATATEPSCACTDVVFMIDASQSIRHRFFVKLIAFTKMVLNKLPHISDDCIHVGVMRWSRLAHVDVPLSSNNDLVELENIMDTLKFLADVTYTHVAIEEFTNQIKNVGGREGCQPVGVLLTDGMTTDWRATLTSMVTMYTEVADAKIVVVAVIDPDVHRHPRPDEVVQSLATGTGDENIVTVHSYDDLDGDHAQRVADSIIKGYTPLNCTKYVVLNTAENRPGNHFLGVYEQTQLEWCNDKPVYQHIGGHRTLAVQSIQYGAILTVPANWMLTSHRFTNCTLHEGDTGLVYAWDTSGAGDVHQTSMWQEVIDDWFTDSNITVSSYH